MNSTRREGLSVQHFSQCLAYDVQIVATTGLSARFGGEFVEAVIN